LQSRDLADRGFNRARGVCLHNPFEGPWVTRADVTEISDNEGRPTPTELEMGKILCVYGFDKLRDQIVKT